MINAWSSWLENGITEVHRTHFCMWMTFGIIYLTMLFVKKKKKNTFISFSCSSNFLPGLAARRIYLSGALKNTGNLAHQVQTCESGILWGLGSHGKGNWGWELLEMPDAPWPSGRSNACAHVRKSGDTETVRTEKHVFPSPMPLSTNTSYVNVGMAQFRKSRSCFSHLRTFLRGHFMNEKRILTSFLPVKSCLHFCGDTISVPRAPSPDKSWK